VTGTTGYVAGGAVIPSCVSGVTQAGTELPSPSASARVTASYDRSNGYSVVQRFYYYY